jgi:hypothetical protein
MTDIDGLLHKHHTSCREIGHRFVDYVMERAGSDANSEFSLLAIV